MIDSGGEYHSIPISVKYPEWKKNWFDEFGGLHNVRLPHPESTENPMTFLGWFTCRYSEVKKYMGAALITDILMYIENLQHHFDGKVQWLTTPITPIDNRRFSRDNWEMLCATLEVIKRKIGIASMWTYGDVDIIESYKQSVKNIPWFHRQMWHPRTMAIVWRTKLGSIAQPLMWTMWIYFFITAKQGHKTRGGVKIAKTDGKLIADAVCTAFGLATLQKYVRKWTAETVHEAPVPRHGEIIYVMTDKKDTWRWGSIRNCAHDYFKGNSNHPVVELYDMEIENAKKA